MSLRSQRFGLFSFHSVLLRDCAIGYFSLLTSKNQSKKVISSTFQTNINLHMFRYEFVVKKRFFEGRCG